MTKTRVFINVADVNDNSPVFTANISYSGKVSEGMNSNTNVETLNNKPLVIRATDRDSGANGDVRYSFVEETIGIYFKINERTGEIITNKVKAQSVKS